MAKPFAVLDLAASWGADRRLEGLLAVSTYFVPQVDAGLGVHRERSLGGPATRYSGPRKLDHE